MTRRLPVDVDNEDFDDEEYESQKKGVRRFKVERYQEKRKPWDRENYYDRHDDYDDRR